MASKSSGAKKPKTVSRFRNLAGSQDSSVSETDRSGVPDVTGGVVGGLAAAVQAAGHRIRHVEVESLIPHPFNDPARSEPRQDDPDWDVLIRNVKANGVLLPGLAVSRAAFASTRPALAEGLPAAGTHILIYGHRRRAAALAAGVVSMPVVVDDSVMADDGDLDYMASENLGRQDLSPMAEAELFARYSEELGLSQSAIAERLGVDQATVSRRLALLLLTHEAVEALDQELLSVAGAVALAGALPYGRPRRWQKSKHEDQASDERHYDQTAALRLILERNTSPTRAAERVLTERASRCRAAEAGISIIDDPRGAFGADHLAHQIDDPAHGNAVVAAIDDATGTLIYYDRSPTATSSSAEPAGDAEPSVEPAEKQQDSSSLPPGRPGADSEKREADTTAQRLDACARAAQTVPSKTRLGDILVMAVVLGVDFQHPRVVAQADKWASLTTTSGSAKNNDLATVWRRVLAGFEDLVSRQGRWDTAGATYLDLLHERVSHVPTTWERQQVSVMHGA